MKHLGQALLRHLKANVVAWLALMFSITGTAAAVTQIITSADQVATNTIISRAIADGTVATVDLANAAVTKAKLAPAEAWHVVGATGQVAFSTYDCGGTVVCEWKHSGGTTEFYKDPLGTVHLRIATCWSARYNYQAAGAGNCTQNDDGTGHVVVRLPAGYRPGMNLTFHPEGNFDHSYAAIQVGTGGSVSVNDTAFSVTEPYEILFRADL